MFLYGVSAFEGSLLFSLSLSLVSSSTSGERQLSACMETGEISHSALVTCYAVMSFKSISKCVCVRVCARVRACICASVSNQIKSNFICHMRRIQQV